MREEMVRERIEKYEDDIRDLRRKMIGEEGETLKELVRQKETIDARIDALILGSA